MQSEKRMTNRKIVIHELLYYFLNLKKIRDVTHIFELVVDSFDFYSSLQFQNMSL
jgi:hypothetical protein